MKKPLNIKGKIKWTCRKRKEKLPNTKVFGANMQFNDEKRIWSLVVYVPDDIAGTIASNEIIYFGFLAEQFPYNKIKPGIFFNLMEGFKKVGVCEVLSVSE